MRNIKLTIEYDGSSYHGWQMQKNAISVQEVISGAILKLTGEQVILEGAGRTDRGVHAYGQVASFKTDSAIPGDKFSVALNRFLPDDICIVASEDVDPGFHARFSAKGKHYRYLIINRRQRSPIWDKRAWHVRDALDIPAMEEAALIFLGRHNFEAFCAAGHHIKTFERTITRSEWTQNGDILQFDTMGDGYLYNMVRIMVGAMVDIGRGRFTPDVIARAIETGNRNDIGMTAPAQGLYLMEVFY